jgi:hypothetical protein
VKLFDGDVAVQQFVASSPNACRGPATDQPGQPIATRQQRGNGATSSEVVYELFAGERRGVVT